MEKATAFYEKTLSKAGPYLTGRGIGSVTAKRFRLGYVEEPFSTAHESYRGAIAIPYQTHSGVVAIRFRLARDDGPWRYLEPPKSGHWLFNVGVLADSPDEVALIEGEMDTIVTQAYAGIPAVGMAGVNRWKKSFAKCFESAGRVLVVGDGGEAGKGMVERLCEEIPNAVPAQMPDNHDCNSYYLEHGADALREYLLGKL